MGGLFSVKYCVSTSEVNEVKTELYNILLKMEKIDKNLSIVKRNLREMKQILSESTTGNVNINHFVEDVTSFEEETDKSLSESFTDLVSLIKKHSEGQEKNENSGETTTKNKLL